MVKNTAVKEKNDMSNEKKRIIIVDVCVREREVNGSKSKKRKDLVGYLFLFKYYYIN